VRFFARQEGGQLQPVGVIDGEILGAVHGDIHLAVKEPFLDRRDEHTLASKGRQRPTGLCVALGADYSYLDLAVGIAVEVGTPDGLGLDQRQG
jgi:hypothetical protein